MLTTLSISNGIYSQFCCAQVQRLPNSLNEYPSSGPILLWKLSKFYPSTLLLNKSLMKLIMSKVRVLKKQAYN